mgnify:CR=1 FL=1
MVFASYDLVKVFRILLDFKINVELLTSANTKKQKNEINNKLREGQIDILILNSGGPPAGNFASTDIASYETALQNGLMSMIAMTKLVVPAMQTRKWGRVVAITSVAVRQPIASLILSNTVRAGLTGFLKTVSREVAPDGVTVNTIQPGIHATDRITQLYGSTPDVGTMGIPAGVIGDPKDFGNVTAFLCSESAKFITGANLQVDGGAYSGLI